MQHRINPEMDIITYVLGAVLASKPDDSFCKSLQQQYFERGGLSRKQLEGLYAKAQRLPEIHPGRLATLEAIIKKKHVTHRSAASSPKNEAVEKDAETEKMIREVLEKFPAHKRVLFFRTNFEKNGVLTTAESEEMLRFYRLLCNK